MPYLAKVHVPIPNKDLISWMFDDIKYDQDKPIYHDAADPTKTISARQAKSYITKIAAGLQKAGLKKGQTVCLHSLNHLHYSMIVLGVVAAGCVLTATNPAYTPRELAHHVSITKSKAFIVEPEFLPNLAVAIEASGLRDPPIFLFDHDGKKDLKYPSWTSLLEHGEVEWPRFDDEQTSRNTTAMLLTTSGTTGLPKAAMLSHYNFVAEHTLVWERHLPTKPYPNISIIPLPMFHAAMAPFVHTSMLRSGFKTYIMRRFDVDQFMQHIHDYRPTELVMVPPVILRVVMSPNVNKYDFTSVKHAQAGAAPLDPDLQARFQKLIPHGVMTQVWGMTESCCIVTDVPWPEPDIGSVGYTLPNTDIKFIDDDGNEVLEKNQRGEMCVRGPTIVRGYFENPEANARDFDADGYYHSGDVGIMSESGKISIVDRKKELIKVRGFQVAPNEIEGLLLGHPAIVDTAVIGITTSSSPDAELVRAYVVLREGKSVTENQIMDYLNPQITYYKKLTAGVKFVPAIPKTASGKILKRLLREEANKEFKSQGAKL